jgi:hypothetical protein
MYYCGGTSHLLHITDGSSRAKDRPVMPYRRQTTGCAVPSQLRELTEPEESTIANDQATPCQPNPETRGVT